MYNQVVVAGKITKLPFEGYILESIVCKAIEVESESPIYGNFEDTRKCLVMIQFKGYSFREDLKIGDIVGIKGHLESGSYIGVDGIASRMILIVCDKITYM